MRSRVNVEQFVERLTELDVMANSAGLTEPQKKIVNEVIEQVKQLVSWTRTAPAQ